MTAQQLKPAKHQGNNMKARHLICAMLLASTPAMAVPANTNPVLPQDRSTTLSNSAKLIASASQTVVTVSIQNLDTTINECYSWTTTTPVCGAAGTYTILPGVVHFWPAGTAPNTALYMIAASGTPSVSVTEGF